MVVFCSDADACGRQPEIQPAIRPGWLIADFPQKFASDGIHAVCLNLLEMVEDEASRLAVERESRGNTCKFGCVVHGARVSELYEARAIRVSMAFPWEQIHYLDFV